MRKPGTFRRKKAVKVEPTVKVAKKLPSFMVSFRKNTNTGVGFYAHLSALDVIGLSTCLGEVYEEDNKTWTVDFTSEDGEHGWEGFEDRAQAGNFLKDLFLSTRPEVIPLLLAKGYSVMDLYDLMPKKWSYQTQRRALRGELSRPKMEKSLADKLIMPKKEKK